MLKLRMDTAVSFLDVAHEFKIYGQYMSKHTRSVTLCGHVLIVLFYAFIRTNANFYVEDGDNKGIRTAFMDTTSLPYRRRDQMVSKNTIT